MSEIEPARRSRNIVSPDDQPNTQRPVRSESTAAAFTHPPAAIHTFADLSVEQKLSLREEYKQALPIRQYSDSFIYAMTGNLENNFNSQASRTFADAISELASTINMEVFNLKIEDMTALQHAIDQFRFLAANLDQLGQKDLTSFNAVIANPALARQKTMAGARHIIENLSNGKAVLFSASSLNHAILMEVIPNLQKGVNPGPDLIRIFNSGLGVETHHEIKMVRRLNSDAASRDKKILTKTVKEFEAKNGVNEENLRELLGYNFEKMETEFFKKRNYIRALIATSLIATAIHSYQSKNPIPLLITFYLVVVSLALVLKNNIRREDEIKKNQVDKIYNWAKNEGFHDPKSAKNENQKSWQAPQKENDCVAESQWAFLRGTLNTPLYKLTKWYVYESIKRSIDPSMTREVAYCSKKADKAWAGYETALRADELKAELHERLRSNNIDGMQLDPNKPEDQEAIQYIQAGKLSASLR